MVCRVTGMIFPVSGREPERTSLTQCVSMPFECVAAGMETEDLVNLCQATSKVSVAEANCERNG